MYNAKFAPVAPPRVLSAMKANGVLGDYHLLLAHDVVAQKTLYWDIFHEDEESFIIMDNSLVELGKPVSLDVMKRAKDIVNANVVVLPDHLGERDQTIGAIKAALPSWKEAGLAPFMAVLQGKTLEQVVACYEALYEIEEIVMWGIPRCLTETLKTRQVIANVISDLDKARAGTARPIHLLGFSDDIEDDIESAKCPGVMGIDSAVPIRLGFMWKNLTVKNANNAPPRGNFWEFAEGCPWHTISNLNSIRKLIVE